MPERIDDQELQATQQVIAALSEFDAGARAELAPETERKAEISAADITKYFKQAGFLLPGAARMTLVNATNAGYLDAGADRGRTD